jgi:hypothetical protein
MQVYPLKADMAALRRFIDSYLNFVDDVERPPFYFQPAIPYVLLQLMHYPSLAVPSQNLTSFKQHELTFSIPLECYAVEDGVLVFKQFAVCTPFIYLDQPVSIIGGRSLFGLPKVALRFDDVHPPDTPTEDAQQVNLSLRVPSITGDAYVTFIEAFRSPRPFTSTRRATAESITTVADAFSAYFSAAAEEWYSMIRFPSSGYERARDIQSMQAMALSIAEQLSSLMPMFPVYRLASEPYTSTADVLLGPSYMDIITLKQVRDAEQTQFAAFQSVVRSTMYLDRVYDFGCLFNPMSPDSTTDIRVLIHNKPEQRIVESLGLEVSGQQGLGDSSVSVLKPRFPYWVNMDLVYGLGTNLYWRGVNTSWSCGELPNDGGGAPNHGGQAPTRRYSTFGSGAQQENPLAVVSPEGLVYIATLPLEKDDSQEIGRQRLSDLVSSLLENDRYDFYLYQPRGKDPYIWLMVRNINDSGVGLPPSQEQEIVLGTFVEWKEKGDPDPERRGIGFMPLYAITDSQSRALTYSEVFGRPIVLGEFEYLGAKWPWPAVGGGKEFDVLLAKTSILPILYSGATPESRELIRITTRRTSARSAAQGTNVQNVRKVPHRFRWFRRPVPRNTSAGATGTSPHARVSPGDQPDYPDSLVIVSLAQVIDCRLPANDSYQAIVMQVTKKERAKPFILGDFKRDPYYLYVNFTRYESVPIVRTLGLQTLGLAAGQNATIEEVQAQHHGWINTAIEENGSIDFAWRLGASSWQYPEDWLYKLRQLDPRIKENMNGLRDKFIDQF